DFDGPPVKVRKLDTPLKPRVKDITIPKIQITIQENTKSPSSPTELVPLRLNAEEVHENPFSPSKPKSVSKKKSAPLIVGYFSRFMEDFEVLQTLGSGSFGKVTRCINKWDGMEYAIKQSNRQIRGPRDK